MEIYVNRVLNLKKIKAVGFDMDHTLVRYHSRNFEALTFKEIIRKLLEVKNYPKEISQLKFDYDRAIRGLVIDRRRGNLLKTGTSGRVKQVYHGLREWEHKEMEEVYRELVIDLENPHYLPLDTTFSISFGALYGALVNLKDENPKINLGSYDQICADLLEQIEVSHLDDSLKSEVRKNIKEYIVQDELMVKTLYQFKNAGKLLLLVTNSDFQYTEALLRYTIDPFLPKGEYWHTLFDLSITVADKPRFFTGNNKFLSVNIDNGLMSNFYGKLKKGVYQGGNARILQRDLNLNGTEILYLGDHIFGDILTLKKSCNWRTALVIEDLEDEVKGLKKAMIHLEKIEELMDKKTALEEELNSLSESSKSSKKTSELKPKIRSIDEKVTKHLQNYNACFNPYWGEFMRAGLEKSRLAAQVEKYACVYMSRITDFLDYSPRNYFRPDRIKMPHEL